MRRRIFAGAAVAGLVAVALSLGGAPAAQAGGSCSVTYSQGNGGGAVSCKGYSLNQAVNAYVECVALRPFPSWKKYTGNLQMGSHIIPSSTWPSCPWPASYRTGYYIYN